jgi:parallel beta-helix repeat protein
MASTNFTSGTVIASSWLNDVNDIAYGIGSSASGKGAALVGSEDVGGYFAGSTTEAQTQEIGAAFGLPGGSTTAILQAAINARSLTLASGTTYELTTTLTIPSNRTLRLNGATIKRQTGAGVFDLIANSDQIGGNTNIKIIGPGTIDGNAAADSLVATDPADRFSGVSLVLVTGSSEVSGITVTGTVNAEAHAGIYLSDCSDVRLIGNNATANDRTGILLFDSVRTMVAYNHSWSNAGSGISGGGNTDSQFIGNHCHDNGSGGNYSGLNTSGLRSRVIGNLSHDNTGAGIAIGEVAHASNESIVSANQAYENTLDGLTITNSTRVMVTGNVLRANVRDGIRVQTSSSEATLIGNCINDNSVLGINLNVGSKHTVQSNRISGNGATGISIGSVSDSVVSCNTSWNNGTVTTANSAGILINTCTGMIVSGNRCFDSAGAGGTQESGIWMAGGSNNVVEHNVVTGNKTNAIRESSSPAYNRRGNKVGTDPLTGTFTAGAGATHVVNNNNAPASASMVLVYATNASALSRLPICSAVVAGTSFTVSSSGAFAGTETYRYEILS